MSNFDEDFFKTLLKEEREECLKGPGLDLELHEAFVEACQHFQDAKDAKDAAEQDLAEIKKKGIASHKTEAQDMLNVWNQAMKDAMSACVEAAKPILETTVGTLTELDLEMSLLRTAILTRATAKGLAKFSNESDLNGQLVETLMNSKKIMKEMMIHGGARENQFGHSMKLYTQIMANVPKDRFQKVNKKLAMAAALEFATPQTEFDTSVQIDALERFQHYEKAHRKGELDPAFSHFKTWEYRLAINSDAPNAQLQWGRDMLMNFAPHIVSIYDEKWRYCYQVKSDVGYRAPKWTSSPRTYQQVLSGGGREGPRAWYGRYICQAFGIPVWGVKQEKNVALSRWTPKGWELILANPPDWSTCHHNDRPGTDFFEEVQARSAVSEQEYYEKVILLECLADACKEKIKKPEDSMFVHPSRVWRSLALCQRQIFSKLATEECYQRTGPSVVVTKLDKYLEELDPNAPPLPFEVEKRGGVIIPAGSFQESSGPKHVKAVPSFGGGTQLHLLDAEAEVQYALPSNISFQEDKGYMLTATVCTVHMEQPLLHLEVDGDETYQIEIPYTLGEWETTKPIQVRVGGLSSLKFYRKKSDACFGLAIKQFTFAPC